MTDEPSSPEHTDQELYEDGPCGHISTHPDGTIAGVNRTFEAWTGLRRAELVGTMRFQDLLTPGGRIYYETHYAPLLHMQGAVRAIAVEILRADGSRMPALVNSVLRRDAGGRPQAVWTSVFDATTRREYEDELLRGRRREHELAERLQRSMLSGVLPSAPECELDVVYRPGESGLAVGGDWYDAFWLDEGETLGLVVGDVVGHGIDAATTMGQLRSAVRALAATDLSPRSLLDRLDTYVRRYDVGKLCTLVYAELAVRTGQLRFAVAGHPPPLVAAPNEEPRFAWGGRSTPLDAFDGAPPRKEASESIAPGGMVLLYTDGLIESRSQPLDAGMERLRGEVAVDGSEAVSTVLARLMRTVPDPDQADDTCVLVARLADRPR